MKKENTRERARLRGYLFECLIMQLLVNNGYREIRTPETKRIRIDRENFVEFRGRGSWHQIDCPLDYETEIPFINPIRLLSEVKFISIKVQKHLISQFIGVIEDIQSNYFSEEGRFLSKKRFTEIGVFFSASGFSEESEKLAFAHNIRTISYHNVPVITSIIGYLKELEEDYLSVRECISSGNQAEFIRLFKGFLSDSNNDDHLVQFSERFNIPDGIRDVMPVITTDFNSIKTSFIANTAGGVLIHFIGNNEFPDNLFNETDVQNVRVFFDRSPTGRRFWISFQNDYRRFYFNPPESLSTAAIFGRREVLNEKERIFKTIHFNRKINNISRNITLRLDGDWINELQSYE